jgi:hypothetical protein
MKTGIRIEAFAALLLAAAPAFAQAVPNDTVKAILVKGAVFAANGQDYEFMPKPDGGYANFAGAPMGAYRVDGAALCLTPKIYGTEACFAMPGGKRSGDRFDVENEHGQPATVTIR